MQRHARRRIRESRPRAPSTSSHELLAQILIYLAYAGGGFAGLVLLRCALLAAFCGLIGILRRVDGGGAGGLLSLSSFAPTVPISSAAEPVDNAYQALRPRVVSGTSAEELLGHYGIEVILMDGFEYTTGSPYLLLAAPAEPQRTRWKLAYRDRQAVIFMRHPPAGLPQRNPAEALDAMEEQCREHLRHDPETPRCAAGLSDPFTRFGDRVRSARWQAIAAEYGAHRE